MNYEQNNGFNNNYNDNNNYNNYNNNGNLNYGYNNPNMMNNNMGNMNNNGKQPLSYHIKRFLIGFLLIALLIFILLWLFPTKQGIKDSMAESLAPLYDRIFAENIDTMKEVIYFSNISKKALPEIQITINSYMVEARKKNSK